MRTQSPEITSNNSVKLLLDGGETFSAIKNTLINAKHSINLEYFLICDDETGNSIKDILTERSRAGVNVRVLFDALGSWRLGRKFIAELREAGVQVQSFMPLTLRNLRAGIIHRDHRKIITADGHTGLLGGVNIGNIYLRQWRDTHLMIEGGAVSVLDRIFADMWNMSGGIHHEQNNAEAIDAGNVPVKIAASGTGKYFRAVADEYIRVISGAQDRIWITTPYLVPDKRFLDALHGASARGVDVRMIIPSNSNHMLASWASQSYIDGLLRHGIRIFIYRDRFIHAKTLIADYGVASVGTANLDTLSFRVNYEVQAFVYSENIVRELEGVFIRDLEHCTEELPSGRKNRPLIQRMKEKAGRLLSPLL